MKDKAAIIGVLIVALGLGVALFFVHNNARKQQQDAQAQIGSLSNEMVSVRANLQEQQQVNMALSNNLATTASTYSNKLSETVENLRATQAGLDKAQADAKAAADAAAAEIAKRDKKISDLESQNMELDKQTDELHTAITNLEGQITVTKNKLANSEGDRKFLLAELQRLVAEKADLEKKFNDVATVQAQVRKLKDELAQERRLDWIRRGVYDLAKQKGGERMTRHWEETATAPAPNPDLNVELRDNGSARVLSETNALPATPPPTAKPQ